MDKGSRDYPLRPIAFLQEGTPASFVLAKIGAHVLAEDVDCPAQLFATEVPILPESGFAVGEVARGIYS